MVLVIYMKDTMMLLHILVSLNRVKVYNNNEDTMYMYMKDTMMVLTMVNLFHNYKKALCSTYSSVSKKSKGIQLQGEHHGHLHDGHHDGPSHKRQISTKVYNQTNLKMPMMSVHILHVTVENTVPTLNTAQCTTVIKKGFLPLYKN